MLTVAALYHFTRFEDPAPLKGPLARIACANGVRGTLLLAPEGINGTIAGTRDGIDAVLAGLDQDDADFAGRVRKTIFTWANIPARIDPRDIARITREVENSVLVKAMAGAKGPNQPTVDFLLSGLSSRLADSMREEMEGLGKVSTRDAEEAMDQVVAAIRRMEAAGDLFMIAAEPDEDEAAVA